MNFKILKHRIKKKKNHSNRTTGDYQNSYPLSSEKVLLWFTFCGWFPAVPVCLLVSFPVHNFPGGSAGKESTCSVGDLGLIPGLGRSPGEGNGYPLQYSGLENPVVCIVPLYSPTPKELGHDWVTFTFTFPFIILFVSSCGLFFSA